MKLCLTQFLCHKLLHLLNAVAGYASKSHTWQGLLYCTDIKQVWLILLNLFNDSLICQYFIAFKV
jgi:hypothetical protein